MSQATQVGLLESEVVPSADGAGNYSSNFALALELELALLNSAPGHLQRGRHQASILGKSSGQPRAGNSVVAHWLLNVLPSLCLPLQAALVHLVHL